MVFQILPRYRLGREGSRHRNNFIIGKKVSFFVAVSRRRRRRPCEPWKY